jgi:cellulose synthase/poly-beta-1,6-N-acetylglucosamine synthase-like glycosyltransferase
MIHDAFEIAFALSAGGVVYAYALYPLCLRACSYLFGQTFHACVTQTDEVPGVSLLIAAHNEEEEIESRLRNALATDYPADRLQIVLASDGSSDRTLSIGRRFESVTCFHYPIRRGKAAVLNESIGRVASEIVILSDANTHFAPDALRKLVQWFGDPNVIAVCGRLELVDPATGRNADGLYWKYETFLKVHEARLQALLGGNGAIYAIRRRAYVQIPSDTVVDDFVIPLLAQLKFGGALRYDESAVAYEETPAAIGSEFKRRSRIGAGGFQSIGLLWPLLNPRRGWIAYAFFSHKILRWLCPFFLLAALLLNMVLATQSSMWRWVLVGQLAFYFASLAMAFIPARVKVLKPLRLTTMFTAMNASLLIGFVRWVRGTQSAAWQRTARHSQ